MLLAKRGLTLAFLLLSSLAPLAAQAITHTKLPILHLIRKQVDEDQAQHNYCLFGGVDAGVAGTLSLYHRDPEIYQDGPFAGLPSLPPDQVITDFSVPLPIQFQSEEVWMVFHPIPKSKMSFVLQKFGIGGPAHAGTWQVKMDANNVAYFKQMKCNRTYVRNDRAVMAKQIMLGSSKDLKYLSWALRL